MRTTYLLGFLILALSAQTAIAQRNDSYFAFYGGTSWTGRSDLHVRQAATNTDAVFHGVTWRSEPTTPTPYYGLRLGTFFARSPHWGVELNYNHNRAIVNSDRAALVTGTWLGAPVNTVDTIDTRVQKVRITNGESVIAINLLYRTLSHPTPSFPRGRTQFYAGAGPALIVVFDTDTVNGMPNHGRYRNSGIGWDALIGMRYGISREVSISVEPRFTHADAVLTTANGGQIKTPLDTFHLTFAVLYRL